MMMAVMELTRGHSESAMKSERVGAAWAKKRQAARSTKKPLSAKAPSWLRLADGEWHVIPERGKAVKTIFKMAIAGHGIRQIAEKVGWPKASVFYALHKRAVLGEYQPGRGKGRARKADGAPIAGYYPAVIDEQTWLQAQAALKSRQGRKGRLPKKGINIFQGLLTDAVSGCPIYLRDKGEKSGGVVLSVEEPPRASFPFWTFEAAILRCLREIDPKDVLPNQDGPAQQIMALEGRQAVLVDQIEKLKARLRVGYSDALVDVLQGHELELKDVKAQLDAAKREAATPLSRAWEDLHSLADADKARLRTVLRRTVEDIDCVFTNHGRARLAYVQVFLTGGRSREYLIYRTQSVGGFAGKKPAAWSVATWSCGWGTDFERHSLKDSLCARMVRVFLSPCKPADPSKVIDPEEWGEEPENLPDVRDLVRVMEKAATPEGGKPDPAEVAPIIQVLLNQSLRLLRGRPPAVE
jgi:hypothetical protein